MRIPPIFYFHFVSPDPCKRRQACILLRAADEETPKELFLQDGSFLVKFCLKRIAIEGTSDVTRIKGKDVHQAFNLPCGENSALRWHFTHRPDRSWYYVIPYNPDSTTALDNALLLIDEKEFREECPGFRAEFRKLL